MRTLWPILFLLFALLPESSFANKVIQASKSGMAITQSKKNKWEKGDWACVVRNKRRIACGKIVKASSSKAYVRFTRKGKYRVQRGDRVIQIGSGARSARRKPANKGSSYASARNNRVGRDDPFNITGGFNASFALFYPLVHFQFHISRAIAIGIRPHFFRLTSGNTSLTSFGGHLTLSYYSKKNYKGLWAQLAGGLYNISISGLTDESFTSLAGLATLGWRLRFKSGFNVGIAGGAMYISPQTSNLVEIDFMDAKPMLVLDAGFTF